MPHTPAAAPARAASGASSASFMVAQPAPALRQPTATTRVGLDAQVRSITSLSREEVAELARAAADNCERRCATNFYEPGTWQWTCFNDRWLSRRRELQQWELLQGHESE